MQLLAEMSLLYFTMMVSHNYLLISSLTVFRSHLKSFLDSLNIVLLSIVSLPGGRLTTLLKHMGTVRTGSSHFALMLVLNL